MPIDRKKLLDGRMAAEAALAQPGLPADLQAMFKQALDQANAALGLDEAVQRSNAPNKVIS